ncbi:hypothetical protein MRB53_030691 [Persea americana]|uniref:Uncharacterized protein n=1 Tax=Persea americana TaxID=3435 RepID=A0ACC2KMA2_PERAE|nr:hypothetical protein MRB53_030691 [Persea americana]
MAASSTSSHFCLLPTPPLLAHPTTPHPSKQHLHISRHKTSPAISCTSNSNPTPEPTTPNPPTSLDVERQRKSDMLRQAHSPSTLDKTEPPNFQIGWKRTKEIKLEKPKGFIIMDFLEKLEGLIIRREYGSTQLLAKVGEIVAQGAREEAEVLKEKGEVEERMVTELFRVLKLMEMDLEMVKAAVKEETLNERLEQAKARCRQAILVANSF